MMNRKRRKTHKRGGRKPKTSLGSIIFIVTVVILALVSSVFLFQTRSENSKIDLDTHCKTDDLPQITLVLIDSSDPFDSVQTERAIASLLLVLDRQEPFSRVDIYNARPNGSSLIEPFFTKCKPPKPRSELISNADSARKFEAEYRQAIEKAFTSAVGLPGSNTSPILESIREASTRSFSRAPETTQRKVIIISDMLQNSDVVSHYRGIGKFENFKKSAGWPLALTDFKNAKISIRYITRAESRNIQGIEHQEWWRAYFSAVNGYVIDVESY